MNRKVFNILRNLAIIACIAFAVYEAVYIYLEYLEYDVAKNEYEEIVANMVEWPASEDEAAIVEYPLIHVDFEGLKEINPDYVGWIYFPCLDISYPVVKEQEIDQYLRLTFDGKQNKSGCIYEDVLSDAEFNGMHDIVFGHNMRDGSMFGKLKKLYQTKDEDLLSDNPYVYIYTKDYVFEYRVFGYYQTTVGSQAYKVVDNADDYDELIEYIKYNSAYPRPEDADFSQRPGILTLSTCSGASGSSKRFVVHTFRTGTFKK